MTNLSNIETRCINLEKKVLHTKKLGCLEVQAFMGPALGWDQPKK